LARQRETIVRDLVMEIDGASEAAKQIDVCLVISRIAAMVTVRPGSTEASAERQIWSYMALTIYIWFGPYPTKRSVAR
jgi:hypothetical protein